MHDLPARERSQKLTALAAAGLFALASATPSLAAEEADAPKGAAVTVLTAKKSCFNNIVEVSGIFIARDETMVRPERQGLKVAEVLADAGETVTAGQTLARLTLPEGGVTLVQAPVAGLISASTAVVGAMASAKGEALFSILARNDYDLAGTVPSEPGKWNGTNPILPMAAVAVPITMSPGLRTVWPILLRNAA